MRIIDHPSQEILSKALQRPYVDNTQVAESVREIMDTVKANGDEALKGFGRQFDQVELENLVVSDQEIEEARKLVDEELQMTISQARQNIEKFHASQKSTTKKIETMPGVFCWRRSVAIEQVGIYIPGGSAPLFSTVLMLAVPARLAGCKSIILCSPPSQNGKIHPAILYTADLIGLDVIIKAGGAQAIAAMTYGTASVPKVSKIFGPGNQYVTKAKELAMTQGVSIDMPAGPSEVMVVADKTADPSFVAIDLLSQAEHGPDSQVILVASEMSVVDDVLTALDQQVAELPRQGIAKKAIENSVAIVSDDFQTTLSIINQYAPEHLIINTANATQVADQVINAGSIFIGPYSAESIGDYASGTNHTLPTNGYARMYSGVSLDSFVKKITYQEITPLGLKNIGPIVESMAEAEQLHAHKRAVSIRLESLKNQKA